MRYTKRQRKTAYQWILDLATKIAIRVGKSKIAKVEWRIAAKQWLLKNDLVNIDKAGKVLPIFIKICAIISNVVQYCQRTFENFFYVAMSVALNTV